MTLIVGILCTDGVVLASDSAATYGTGYGTTIGQQSVKKLHVIDGQIVFGATGAIGTAQLIEDKIATLWRGKHLAASNPVEVMNKIGVGITELLRPYLGTSAALTPLIGNAAAAGPIVCKCLAAMYVGGTPRLFEFYEAGVPESYEELRFAAVGSGQAIADPFLALLARVLWREHPPTLVEGRFVATWTLLHTIQTNPGGVGGAIQLISLGKNGSKVVAETLDGNQIQEHIQRVEEAERAIYNAVVGGGEPAPAPPRPPVTES